MTRLKPHVIIKGGDYTEEQMVGADLVKSYGGEVVILPFKGGYSTSQLVERITHSHHSPKK